jgi:hypothetical protein
MALQNGMPREQIPGLDAVKRVNSREFSAEFDSLICEQSERFPFGARAFGRLCQNREECESAVSTFKKCGYERWIAKPQFSHAGRNRLLANGWDLNAAQSGWLTKQLRDPCGVYMEPWVESLNQAGLQFQIRNPAAGGPDIRCIGVTQLLTDPVGRYLGSIFALNAELEEAWKPAVEHGYRVCEAAAAAGYFGPIGIDCFRFRTTDGFIATRVCNDINARHTMGRLALQLRPRLHPGEYGLWCQVTSVQFSGFLAALQESLSDAGFGDVRAEGTSPKMMGIDPVRTGTVFFAGKSIAQLLKLSETLQAR